MKTKFLALLILMFVFANVIAYQIRIPEFFFDSRSDVLKNSEKTKLNSLIFNTLKENNKIYIELIGKSNCIGSKRFKQKLSFKRAKAVRDYIIEKGVDLERIIYIGISDSQPETYCDKKCKCQFEGANDVVEIKFISKEIANEIRQKKS